MSGVSALPPRFSRKLRTNSAAYWAIVTLISVANCCRMQLLLAIVADRDQDGSRSTTNTDPSKSGLALRNQATADPAVAPPMITTS